MRISIIIFCYNERDSISKVVTDTLLYLKKISKDYEIILVDDGSTDGTKEICSEIEKNVRFVRLISHEKNLGIGMALKNGYRNVSKDYVCAVPGDGQFDLKELLLIKPFEDNMYYSFYRKKTNYTIYRKSLTWLNRIFNQHFLAIYLRDVNWIKVYKKSHLSLTKPELSSSLIESEICAKLHKCKILPIEIPSNYLSRENGLAKGGNWNTLRKAMLETTKLWWVVYNFKPYK